MGVCGAQSSTGASDRMNDEAGSSRSAMLRRRTASGDSHCAATPMRCDRSVRGVPDQHHLAGGVLALAAGLALSAVSAQRAASHGTQASAQ